MTFIDMFSGMGTARMAFEQAGHECVYSVEWDKHKRRMYDVIFGAEPAGCDIRAATASELPRAEVWIAGFPCQDISVAGNQLGFNGVRSSLFFEVVRLLQEIKEEDRPSHLLFENVKNFLSVNGGRDFLTALCEMDAIGYDAEWDLLNSKHFGVPQNRERVFIVGHLRSRSTRKIFPVTKDSRIFDIANTTNEGQSQAQIRHGVELRQLIPGSDGQRVYESEGLARTLKAEGGGQGAKTGLYQVGESRIRRLTPRECFRLQAVPEHIIDRILSSGISDTQCYRAAGDAMTVSVVYEIAKQMR